MFGSVWWGGNISKFDREGLEKIVKKEKEKKILWWESHWIVLLFNSNNTVHEKKDYKKIMQILIKQSYTPSEEPQHADSRQTQK